jgi:hypothetical protein
MLLYHLKKLMQALKNFITILPLNETVSVFSESKATGAQSAATCLR